jgi:hypothetical protein
VPHRKSPSGIAKNFIIHNAQFDRLCKESVSTVSSADVLAELNRVFPDGHLTSAVFPEGLIPIANSSEVLLRGLVLDDTYGKGALQVAGKPLPKSIIDLIQFQLRQRECQNAQ